MGKSTQKIIDHYRQLIDTSEGYNYIENRLFDQMAYYSETSKKLQKKHKACSIINILATGVIPVLTIALSTESSIVTYIIAVTSAIASISTSLSYFSRYKDRWLQYRITLEDLKREYHMFQSGAGHYTTDEGSKRLSILVDRCECIMDSERCEWRGYMNKDDSL